MNTLATLSIVAGVLSLLSLLTLHFTSPEIKPGWRMVSEYALGKYKWLLTIFFITWGASSLLLAFYLVNIVHAAGYHAVRPDIFHDRLEVVTEQLYRRYPF